MATDENQQTAPETHQEIPALGIELGTDMNLAFSTPFRPYQAGVKKSVDEELHELLREESEESGPTVRQLVVMRRTDGHARALYRLITLPIRAALQTATFVPAEGGEKEAEYIENVFRTAPSAGGMTVTFQRFMSQMLNALFDGFSAFEKVFWIPISGPLEGKITLKKLAHRPSETVTFVVDKTGGYAGFRQRAQNSGKIIDVYVEPDYSFYYAAQEEEKKFYGLSFFESAFYHYDKKVKMYFTAHLAAQRAAVGTRIGTVPTNASNAAKREFASGLSNLAFAQFMMVPDGFKVELLKESGGFDFLNFVNHHNHMMSESILANFFDKDSGGGSGESGSLVNFAQPGDDMFLLMLRAVMDDVASQINHYIIPQLIDFNFHGQKYPTFTWGKLTDEQRAAISATFDKLATAGQSVNATPEFMRALEENVAAEMGLEIDYDEVDARIEEEQAAAEAQIAAAQGLPGAPGAPAAPGAAPGDGSLPEDGSGAPAPAGPTSPDDAAIKQFEKEALSLSVPVETYEGLMRLAGEMLDAIED